MIYVSTSCIKNDKICETVEEYAKCGIKNIELSGGTRYYSGWDEDLLELKKKYNLNYAFHAYFPPPETDFVVNLAAYEGDLDKISLEYYLRNIPIMKRLECDVLSIHAGFFVEISPVTIGKGISLDRVYNSNLAEEHFIKNYLHLDRETRKNGIKLLLENNVLSYENYINFGQKNYFMLTDLHDYIHLNNKMPFCFLLDLGHLYVSCNTLGHSFSQQAEQLIRNASWIHISDNSGIMDEHRIVKEDSIILTQLIRSKVSGVPITMETKGTLNEVVQNYQMLYQKLEAGK